MTYAPNATSHVPTSALWVMAAILSTGCNSDDSHLTDVDALPALDEISISCTNGLAQGFACANVDFLAFLSVADLGGGAGAAVNDMWGWTDPQTGTEYALVGRSDAVVFVNLANPADPVVVGELPMSAGARASHWRDVKVYSDHAFVVADNAGAHGVQVFDLTQLRGLAGPPVVFEETARYDGIGSAHNIAINEESGFAYSVGSGGGGETCGGGLHMIDIGTPSAPTFAGCFSDPTTGRRGTGYTHDVQCVMYNGPDADYQGSEICLGANETALSIADVSDKADPIAISSGHYPNRGYAHQGWITDDHSFFFTNDELDEVQGLVAQTRTMIWDISDLDDPVLAREFLHDSPSSDHNLYVRGQFMYQSNYRSGLRIFDISNPLEPLAVGFFDSVVSSDGAGFGGSWSNYPFFESGLIAFTSREEGLLLVWMP